MTYQGRIINGLIAIGAIPDPVSSTRKYKAFTFHRFVKSGHRLFVGLHEALRKGPCASNSISLGDPGNQTPFYKGVLNGIDIYDKLKAQHEADLQKLQNQIANEKQQSTPLPR